jgi:hypothetical protein
MITSVLASVSLVCLSGIHPGNPDDNQPVVLGFVLDQHRLCQPHCRDEGR